MNLYISTYLLGLIYLLAGLPFLFPSEGSRKFVGGFLRGKKWAIYLTLAATAWFVYILSQLGEADFGDYKLWLILIFGGAGLLSIKFLDDFLSVRALCVILLLACRAFIDSAFMQEPEARKIMVAGAYFLVVACMYFGCLPYRARDLSEWLYAKPARAKAFGIATAAYAVICVLITFSY